MFTHQDALRQAPMTVDTYLNDAISFFHKEMYGEQFLDYSLTKKILKEHETLIIAYLKACIEDFKCSSNYIIEMEKRNDSI